MALLPLVLAIPRFKGNEERVDIFVNGDENAEYIASDGEHVPSIQNLIHDWQEDIDDLVNTVPELKEKLFTGDGVTTTFTLDAPPTSKANLLVWIGGSIQDSADYSVTGSTLTITPAVANGIQVRTLIVALVTSSGMQQLRDDTVAAATEADVARDEAVAAATAIATDRRILELLPAQPGKTMPPETGWLQRYLHITGDNLDALTATGNPIARGMRLAHEVGGSTLTGGRIASETSIIHTATDSPTNTVKEFSALTGSAYGFAPGAFGGTALSRLGALYGGNSIVTTVSGYTHTANITSHEFNTKMEPGSSTDNQSGIQVVNLSGVHGDLVDTGISVSAGGDGAYTVVGWNQGMTFGDQNSKKPITDTGVILGDYSRLGGDHVGGGFASFLKWDFQSYIMRFKKFVVQATGSILMGNGSSQVQIDGKSHTWGAGLTNQFDGRIAITGGQNNVNGGGVMTLLAALISLSGKTEIANVAGLVDSNDHFTFSADNSGFYIRWKTAAGVQKIISLGPWVNV